jgi:hypothetical protein
LSVLSELEIDTWMSFHDAYRGRAVFTAPGGLLVLNVEDDGAPYAQAFFPSMGIPRQFSLDGDALLFASGLYGVYRFDLNEMNLVSP